MDITITGVEQLKRNIEAMRQRMTTTVARKAVREGAKVIAGAMAEAAPILDKKTAKSNALEPGSLKADIRARNTSANGETAAIAGPTKKTAYVARFVEYGHRNVRGGYSKAVGDGTTRGPGRQLQGDNAETPEHPFLRPAFEQSVDAAIAARDQVLAEGLKDTR